MKTALEIICNGAAERHCQILLIGGYALPVFDVVRQTADVDSLIADADERILHDILIKAGYKERQRTEAFVRYTHPSAVALDIDVMLVDQDTFDKMLKRSSEHQVGSVKVRIPCLPHLIALKLHAIKNNPKRELKDLGDIMALLEANPEKVSQNELRRICKRYGPAGIFNRLEKYQ
ncbi:MAG: nucleotidyltransferase family protein [Verrucomicrobiota bacterium]